MHLKKKLEYTVVTDKKKPVGTAHLFQKVMLIFT